MFRLSASVTRTEPSLILFFFAFFASFAAKNCFFLEVRSWPKMLGQSYRPNVRSLATFLKTNLLHQGQIGGALVNLSPNLKGLQIKNFSYVFLGPYVRAVSSPHKSCA